MTCAARWQPRPAEPQLLRATRDHSQLGTDLVPQAIAAALCVGLDQDPDEKAAAMASWRTAQQGGNQPMAAGQQAEARAEAMSCRGTLVQRAAFVMSMLIEGPIAEPTGKLVAELVAHFHDL